jgi:hypothetical protein
MSHDKRQIGQKAQVSHIYPMKGPSALRVRFQLPALPASLFYLTGYKSRSLSLSRVLTIVQR